MNCWDIYIFIIPYLAGVQTSMNSKALKFEASNFEPDISWFIEL